MSERKQSDPLPDHDGTDDWEGTDVPGEDTVVAHGESTAPSGSRTSRKGSAKENPSVELDYVKG